MTDKCTRLRKEVDDQRDLLTEVERREETCKLELKKLEKSYFALQKKVEKLESEVNFFTSIFVFYSKSFHFYNRYLIFFFRKKVL